jgi:hypothetical protein
MSVKLLALYFVVGGVIVAAVTYFGSQGKGLLAAFVAFFPSVTVVTLVKYISCQWCQCHSILFPWHVVAVAGMGSVCHSHAIHVT